jgi:hypothetical protein
MHLLKKFIHYFIASYAFTSFQNQDKMKIWIQIRYNKFHLEFQVACGGIEPQFYKEFYPLQHKLLAKTYTHPNTPTPTTQEVAIERRCCILINNRNKMPMISQVVVT